MSPLLAQHPSIGSAEPLAPLFTPLSMVPRPHRQPGIPWSTAVHTWSRGTLGENSRSGDSGENQTPSHPLPNLPLTYPLPTIAFVTLEDRS